MGEKMSQCEEKIMLVVWEAAEAPDMREVMELANRRYSKEWKPQTVSTFLARLVQKGYLTAARKGRYTHYHPVQSFEDYRREKISEVVTEMYTGDRAAAAKDIGENMPGK